jgi:nitrogen fixation protein NifU and related proteins
MSYTPTVLEHFNNPRNSGQLEHPTCEGNHGSPGRGNYMIIQLRIENGTIAEAMFQTYGCPGAIACGSAITELAKDKPFKEVQKLDRNDIDKFLGGLPLGKGHCADLAAKALDNALNNCIKD